MIKVVIATTAALSMLVRRNSSLLSAAAALASVAVIMPGVAGAAPAVPKGETATQDFPAGELCAFPVRVTTVYGQTDPQHRPGRHAGHRPVHRHRHQPDDGRDGDLQHLR